MLVPRVFRLDTDYIEYFIDPLPKCYLERFQ
jgi:hypothetical protein